MMSTSTCVGTACTQMSREGFWSGVSVWSDKPHVLNRRVWGATPAAPRTCVAMPGAAPWDPYLYCSCLDALPVNQLTDDSEILNNLMENMKIRPLTPNDSHSGTIEVSIVKLLPKISSEPFTYQFIAKSMSEDMAFFAEIGKSQNKHAISPSFPYSFHWGDSKIVLKALYDGSAGSSDQKSLKWLQEVVMPQMVKWGEEAAEHTQKSSICSISLNLVSSEVYYNKYNYLKTKHGKEMVKIWPEKTDPIKFVYEDVAIATYLLVLWESERERLGLDKLQTFVDLGCGNGLLVYILVSEGHTGHGIDVRRRKIWDMYPSNVVLQERTISPSDLHLFPDVDWIIGNHSDELTPWIPVIAARSSYKCNYFLLPCCCYNFNGSKYQRRDSSKSQYAEYMEYIYNLCNKCGFKTSIDRLKIPSTKRICFIGAERQYTEDNFKEMSINIQNLIDASGTGQVNKDEWISDFKPRQAAERVRNCTQIDKSLIESIVKIIGDYLINDCGGKCDSWNRGKLVEINEIATLVPSHMLKSLKSECGGLQTLLKNQHQVFEVRSGKVQFKYPQTVLEVMQKQKNGKGKLQNFSGKKKACWFHSNHPQGCPLTDEHCSFLHENK